MDPGENFVDLGGHSLVAVPVASRLRETVDVEVSVRLLFECPSIASLTGRDMRKEHTVTNPFEDPDAKYFVLVNVEGQHSLWPRFANVPEGWRVIFGEEGRQQCLDFIDRNWTDMRPKSLIEAMEADAAESMPQKQVRKGI